MEKRLNIAINDLEEIIYMMQTDRYNMTDKDIKEYSSNVQSELQDLLHKLK